MGGTYSAPTPPPQTQPIVFECGSCSGMSKLEVPGHFPFADQIGPAGVAELSQLLLQTLPKYKRDTLPIMIAAPIGFLLTVSMLAVGVPAAAGAVVFLAVLAGLGLTMHWRGFNRTLDDELFNKVLTWNNKQAAVDVQYVSRNTEVCRAKGAVVYRGLWFKLQQQQQQPQQPGAVPVAIAMNPAGQPMYQPQPGVGGQPMYQPQPGVGGYPAYQQQPGVGGYPAYQQQPGVGGYPAYQQQPGVGAPAYQQQPGVGAPPGYPAYQQPQPGAPRVAYAAGQPAYSPATAQPATAPSYPAAQPAAVGYKPTAANGKITTTTL